MLRQAVATVLCLVGSCQANHAGMDIDPALLENLERVRQGHYEEAISYGRELGSSFAEHPLTSLITAEAYWGLIYCETGHITSRDIWRVAERKTSGYDQEFQDAVEKALEASQKMRERPETSVLGTLYVGLVRGLRGRLHTFRGEKTPAASEGKQMRAALLEVIAQDSQLASDAYLGLGVYNYYADILSPFLKFIRFFLGIPGGDRKQGLEQLQEAAKHASVVAVEAQYELAHIYGLYEKRHADALLLLEKLSGQYPANALYALAAAFQADLAGEKGLAIKYARQATKAAEAMDDVCRQRLGKVSQEALERLDGGRGR